MAHFVIHFILLLVNDTLTTLLQQHVHGKLTNPSSYFFFSFRRTTLLAASLSGCVYTTQIAFLPSFKLPRWSARATGRNVIAKAFHFIITSFAKPAATNTAVQSWNCSLKAFRLEQRATRKQVYKRKGQHLEKQPFLLEIHHPLVQPEIFFPVHSPPHFYVAFVHLTIHHFLLIFQIFSIIYFTLSKTFPVVELGLSLKSTCTFPPTALSVERANSSSIEENVPNPLYIFMADGLIYWILLISLRINGVYFSVIPPLPPPPLESTNLQKIWKWRRHIILCEFRACMWVLESWLVLISTRWCYILKVTEARVKTHSSIFRLSLTHTHTHTSPAWEISPLNSIKQNKQNTHARTHKYIYISLCSTCIETYQARFLLDEHWRQGSHVFAVLFRRRTALQNHEL